MILIDFAHLCYRCVFSVVGEKAYPTKKNPEKGMISIEEWEKEYKGLFIHYIFSYLKHCKKEYSNEFGNEVVIALEGGDNWRKEIYKEYKANRSNDKKYNLDFEGYIFPTINEIIEVIKNTLNYKCIRLNGVEGDDIIATLSKYSSTQKQEKTLIISEDKDFKQLLKFKNVCLYKPISEEFFIHDDLENEKYQMELNLHILLGDKSDNIPNIKKNTEFSDNFLLFLGSNGIYEKDVYNFKQMEVSEFLIEKFKNENSCEDDLIYKNIRFGEVGAKKFIDGSIENLKINLSKNRMYFENFKRNKILIDLECVPKDLQEKIIEEYLNIETNYDMISLIKFFKNYACEKHISEISLF